MKIYVDADACPNPIKDILFKAAQRTKIHCLFVANHAINVPPSPFLQRLQVSAGFDVADNEIVKRSEAHDLVITSDIPLAAELIEKDVIVLAPRGELFDKQTIRSRLNTRDFMETMRASGFQTSGPPPLSQRDKKAFADNLDRILAKAK